MKRAHYIVGGLAALMFALLIQSNGGISSSVAGMPSQSVATTPIAAPTPVPDVTSEAIDDLASWPIAATRK